MLIASAYAIEGKCEFEEVYKNSETQKGIVLFKKDKFRYEYQNTDLYTIIKNDNKVYIVENKNKKFRELKKSENIIEKLSELLFLYPDISSEYVFDDIKLKIEKSVNIDFIKRVSVLSKKLNMSIYFHNCEIKPLNNLFFQFNPLFDLV